MMQCMLTLHLREPEWLVVMFGRDGESVQKHQDDHQPIERHRFHRQAAIPTAAPVPATPAPTAKGVEVRVSLGIKHQRVEHHDTELSIPDVK